MIRQNNAWEKSSHNTVLMNVFDHLKIFLPVAEGPNLHHISCTQRHWRKWVQFGPNLSIAIFERCQRNQERPETAGAGHPGPQKRLRSLWLAEDLKCFNYSQSQRDMLWKSAPYASKHIFTPKSFQWFGKSECNLDQISVSRFSDGARETRNAQRQPEQDIQDPKNGCGLCDRQRTWNALITAKVNAICFEKRHHML